ncbi:MAG: HDOD domain-containing protein [Proteobacteria bacterium]|nr:HDOD domain-containing protein [Desulfocapsa sp.]MBU3945400.1 HDOD domain-containing protein [Pseudomonadota bacterium]MBU3983926.1 HDOD domain-containing protein [Pseudomonadota bacterium]MBU4028148.1 HDOD domain-containing protein [Pseudomonadota bacterium]MBU4043198.1 HDOD domain-containing protein [Pseudomonadota bacterium]
MLSAEQFVQKFKNVKTLPYVVTELSRMIANDNTTMKDFEDIIKMDPTLVARLLHLVNSAFYGVSQPVTSIGRAVAFLGMRNLRSMAVTDALQNIFKEKVSAGIFSRKRLWLHCAVVSTCSKILAERIFGINGDDAYLCGILHDFGKIIEEQIATDDFLAACEACKPTDSLIEHERHFLGTDHCEIGFLLSQDWGMSSSIQEAIRDHHTPFDNATPSSLTSILQIAQYITGQMGYSSLPDITSPLSPPLVLHLQENMAEYKVLINDLPEEIAKAQEIYET